MARTLPALVLSAAAVIAACDGGGSKPRPEASAPRPETRLDAGVALPADAGAPERFAALCAICHGKDAQGYAADHAPSLVNASFLESASDDFLFRSIENGRPGTSMAAYGEAARGPLQNAQIVDMVAWLRAKGGVAAPKPLPAFTAGDAKRGGDLYAKHCQSCHGDGKARGEAVWLANPQFIKVAPQPFVRWAIAQGRPGTKMEAWKDKLSAAEIDDLTT
jgi:mono/diheme cytochrome c family protein